ncbi:MAG: aminotransferase class V-fold PLP-dependent enzyme [Marinobacter sp.]|uniref:aminotransferase class V-fold PLP-dependent enzyme n=1 Tax=Marinobacter sp. TaxID=50741 RepID=UPI0032986328
MDISQLAAQVIGERSSLPTPFGEKPLVYADYTASGRAYAPIEAFIRARVMPYYANTHSESSLTGRQTNRLREQARASIREALKAGPEHALIFCGSGATVAINKLVSLLGLRRDAAANEEPAVVLIGPYEHHSNDLPWRESNAQLEVIPLDADGALDMEVLEQRLAYHRGRAPVYASFSAASNVTGLKTDTEAVGKLVHAYGGRVFWDYAAAAPYVGIDMADKDAVFISPHKFLGGPGTPGLLVVRKDLLNNPVPDVPGGGTVSFVAPDFHHYLTDVEHREEGGTPGIIEAIRAGLVFKLQQQVGTEEIEAREEALVKRALARWGDNPNIRVLGNPDLPRLSIISMQLSHEGQQLHYAYVVALLNDLFGIQARGGCSCAGPYGHRLLHIDAEASHALDAEVSRGNAVLRPGWLRLNFNYFIDDETFEYLLRAVELVADHGWRLLSQYRYNHESGSWVCKQDAPVLPVDLADFDALAPVATPVKACSLKLEDCLDEGRRILLQEPQVIAEPVISLDEHAESLRWFYLPAVG